MLGKLDRLGWHSTRDHPVGVAFLDRIAPRRTGYGQRRIGGQAQRADALSRIYTADAGVETAASAATDRTFQLGLERENASVNAALKAAEIRIQENIQLLSQLMDSRRTQAQVMSQLAASAMSAMNFSASVSSARSATRSCATSVTWTGEAPDL